MQVQFHPNGSESHLFKLLIPITVAGAVLGKQGSTILRLAHTSGAKIQLSQTEELYPSTNSRVMTIQGTADGVIQAITMVINLALDRQDSDIPRQHDFTRQDYQEESNSKRADNEEASSVDNTYDRDDNPGSETDTGNADISGNSRRFIASNNYLFRCAVPSSACGMLIGKKGSTIKEMSRRTGCRLTLSNDVPHTVERIITVYSKSISNVTYSMVEIFRQLISDTFVANYENTSTYYHQSGTNSSCYANNNTSGNISRSTGSNGAIQVNHRTDRVPSTAGDVGRGQVIPYQREGQNDRVIANNIIESSNKMVGTNVTTHGVAVYTTDNAMSGGAVQYSQSSGVGATMPLDFAVPFNAQEFMTYPTFYTIDTSTIQHQHGTRRIMMKLGVDNRAVGSLVGKEGRNIKEIMTNTNTIIHISPKDVFLSGTKQREVKVTGLEVRIHEVFMLLVHLVLQVVHPSSFPKKSTEFATGPGTGKILPYIAHMRSSPPPLGYNSSIVGTKHHKLIKNIPDHDRPNVSPLLNQIPHHQISCEQNNGSTYQTCQNTVFSLSHTHNNDGSPSLSSQPKDSSHRGTRIHKNSVETDEVAAGSPDGSACTNDTTESD